MRKYEALFKTLKVDGLLHDPFSAKPFSQEEIGVSLYETQSKSAVRDSALNNLPQSKALRESLMPTKLARQ